MTKKSFQSISANKDSIEGVIFKKNKDYCITIMACYGDLLADITTLPNYTKIKETSD